MQQWDLIYCLCSECCWGWCWS